MLRILVSAAAAACLVTGCLKGPGFLKQAGSGTLTTSAGVVQATVVSSTGGVVTASVRGGSNVTQQVTADPTSAIAGAVVSFPPGAVALDTNVTVQAGAALATADTAAALGFAPGAGVTAASTAVVVSAGTATDAATPFTVSIALAGGSLVDPGVQYEVLYKVAKHSAGDALFLGVIPPSLLKVGGGLVTFQASYFGAYQVVATSAPVATPKEVATAAPIVTAAQQRQQPPQQPAKTPQVPAAGPAGDPVVRLAGRTSSSVTLAWDAVTNAAGYVVTFVTSSGTLTPGCGGGTSLPAATTTFTASGLTAATPYAFRVCSLDAAGGTSPGASKLETTAPAEVTAVTATVLSSSRVDVGWSLPAGTLDGVLVAWAEGVPDGPPPTAPADCSETHAAVPGSSTHAPVTGLTHRTPVAVRVCTVSGSVTSSGVTASAVTGDWHGPTCASGDYDSTCTVSGSFTATAGGPTVISGSGNLILPAGATIQAAVGQMLTIDMGGYVELDGTGVQISADGAGLAPGSGPSGNGAAPSGTTAGGTGASVAAGGGAYGGDGGSSGTVQSALGFGAYANPIDFGAGGGGSGSATSGGSGGGALQISASELRLGTARVSAGGNDAGGTGAGGGSGGSLLVRVGLLGGTGALQANGGAGVGNGGGGGGGRIAVSYQTLSGPPTFFVDGGQGGSLCPTGVCDGGAGTVYLNDLATPRTELRIPAHSSPRPGALARTGWDPNQESLDMVELGGGPAGTSLAQVYLTHPQDLTRAVVRSLTIDQNGVLTARAVGYTGGAPGTSGVGAPNSTGGGGAGTSAMSSGGGGAHEGAGGSGGGSTPGAGGSPYDPQGLFPGSGGGGGFGGHGGNGGGALVLTVQGTVTLDGSIDASGGDGLGTGSSGCGGGGGGGSVDLTAATVTSTSGTGVIVAKGGGGGACSPTPAVGGGGGGGFIKVDGTVTNVSCSVAGGGGSSTGGAGTKTGC